MTRGEVQATTPPPSPDGKTLYFSGNEKDPIKWTTWNANAETSEVKTSAEGCGFVVDISPDGRFLLLEKYTVGLYELSRADKKCTPLLSDHPNS
jgi:Tol biopolymer transport system component